MSSEICLHLALKSAQAGKLWAARHVDFSTMRLRLFFGLCAAMLWACDGSSGNHTGDDDDDDTTGDDDSGPAPGVDGSVPSGGNWPEANDYSWNGSWTPEFPLSDMFDEQYPELPPGNWDWDGNGEGNDDANWRNFETNIGTFEQMKDDDDQLYGWNLVANGGVADFSGAAEYFEGSPGVDWIDTGPTGQMGSYGSGDLRDGPDVLIFDSSHSMHFRTGSDDGGYANDDDLVIAGCDENPDGSFDIDTTTIHTGPGNDWVFIRDLQRAAIDLGNPNGLTDAVDAHDGNDLGVLRGNTYDFRFTGGNGNDVAVWYVDENVQTSQYLGPNFFGAGQWGDAVWDDSGTDRLVLVVPTDTQIVTATPTPPGALLVKGTDGQLIDDTPTADDPLAHYCVECGTSETGRKTVILEYKSADESVFTGYFYMNAFEEVQVGIGDNAKVYHLDDTNGTASLIEDAQIFEPPTPPSTFCE